jgi:hypothetical protein
MLQGEVLQAEELLPADELLPFVVQQLLCPDDDLLRPGAELLCTGPVLLRTGRRHPGSGSCPGSSDTGRTGSCSLNHVDSCSADRVLFDEDGPVFSF